MTINEAKDILINRLDFRVTTPNSVSGRFFEDSHFIVTLSNIKDCQPKNGITNAEFDTYLIQLKESCVYKVLADCFDRDELKTSILTDYPSLFDNALSNQMSILIINLVMTSTRSNGIERITKDMIQRSHFDLNGNYGQNASPNYPRQEGIVSKYKTECRRIQNRLGGQKKLVSITIG